MEWVNDLTMSDRIQLFAAVAALIVGAISCIISVITLFQNKKMIEDESRPYIVVYGVVTQFGMPVLRIVVKNFGKTHATIDSFSVSPEIRELAGKSLFQHLAKTPFAPGQSIAAPINAQDPDLPAMVQFTIKYHNGRKKYHDVFNLNIDAYAEENPAISTKKKPDIQSDIHAISYTLQDYARRHI